MNELKNTISQIVACSIQKIIISKPQEKSNPYKKSSLNEKRSTFRQQNTPRSRCFTIT